jgi:hypothetical protein
LAHLIDHIAVLVSDRGKHMKFAASENGTPYSFWVPEPDAPESKSTLCDRTPRSGWVCVLERRTDNNRIKKGVLTIAGS